MYLQDNSKHYVLYIEFYSKNHYCKNYIYSYYINQTQSLFDKERLLFEQKIKSYKYYFNIFKEIIKQHEKSHKNYIYFKGVKEVELNVYPETFLLRNEIFLDFFEKDLLIALKDVRKNHKLVSSLKNKIDMFYREEKNGITSIMLSLMVKMFEKYLKKEVFIYFKTSTEFPDPFFTLIAQYKSD